MATPTETTRTAFRTCPLCEATCGLEITVQSGRVTRIRGDREDVFSRGFICPKGSTLKHLHDDPDRLRRPLVKRDGVHIEVDWAEAWAEVERGLLGVVERHGRAAIASYVGNPTGHSLDAMLFIRSLQQALGSRQMYSASTVDQMPRQIASAYLFGGGLTVPVPDLDRTDFLMIIGANPYESNGSLCTAPNFPGRIEAIRARGGSVVVVDPRRTRTAEGADRWLAIRPGTDALFLASIVSVLAADGLIAPGPHLQPHVRGLETVVAACAPFTPEVTAGRTGLDPAVVRAVARELAAAPSASVYGRIGTTVNEFGTVTSWLIDVVNIATGNLDHPGGAMFARPAADGAATRPPRGPGNGFRIGRSRTRVRGLPEVMGEYPVAALAEEISTPGDGQVRALLTIAGNPALSTPNAQRLDAALDELEFMISVDMYLNETTRHANVILPPPSQLERGHYDTLFLQYAIRNVANYSRPVLPVPEGQPAEWEIFARLALIAQGKGIDADPADLADLELAAMVRAAVGSPSSPIHGRDSDEILEALSAGTLDPAARILDLMLQAGPFGAAFGAEPGGASLDLLVANPHGIDFGALEPRLPQILRTPSGMIELDHPVLLADVARLAASMDSKPGSELVLVGRRQLRSNNSWMHNVEVLVTGKPRCTLQVHPDDAGRRGLVDGRPARVTSSVGSVDAPVEVTDAIRPGVVSLPHGWGHDQPGTIMRVAAEHAGVNSNILSDHEALDPLSSTSVLNGIPVDVTAI